MSQWAAGNGWTCHYGGHVTVGSRSVVAMSLWGLCHIGQQVSGGHLTVRSCQSVQQVSGGHVTVSNKPLFAMYCGGYVTVGSMSVVVMSLWGPCHSGQQVSGGHVTMGAMSQWAAGQ